MPALLPIALSPGASFTLVMSSAMAGGRKGLFKTLAGTALGIYTHAVLVGLGITAVIASSPAVFLALKVLGTAYLLWLGIILIRIGINVNSENVVNTKKCVTLREAWLTNVLNPKAIIFYLTVVSQFVGRQSGVGSYLILASIHVLIMSIWLLAVSRIVVFSVKKASPNRLKKYINLTGGVVLIIFSLHALFH